MTEREWVGVVAFAIAALILGVIVIDTYRRGLKTMARRKKTDNTANDTARYVEGYRDGRQSVQDTLENSGAMERRHEPSGIKFQVAVIGDELAVSITKGRSATAVFFPLDTFADMLDEIYRRPE